MTKEEYENCYTKLVMKESTFWSLGILNKYCTGPIKYLMENEEQARYADQ